MHRIAGSIWVILILMQPLCAGPRTIDDCEKLKDAEAYNLCLASFGPTRGQHNKSYPGLASHGERTDHTATKLSNTTRRTPATRGGAGHRNGRIRMEFIPKRR
jgi:hypothetical protein